MSIGANQHLNAYTLKNHRHLDQARWHIAFWQQRLTAVLPNVRVGYRLVFVYHVVLALPTQNLLQRQRSAVEPFS